MASISHRLYKFDIVFLAARLSIAEVSSLSVAAPLCAKHHASGSGGSRGILEISVSIRRLAGYFSMLSEHREDVATAKPWATWRRVVITQSADHRPRASDQDQLIDSLSVSQNIRISKSQKNQLESLIVT
jgi:hypothetical protein